MLSFKTKKKNTDRKMVTDQGRSRLRADPIQRDLCRLEERADNRQKIQQKQTQSCVPWKEEPLGVIQAGGFTGWRAALQKRHWGVLADREQGEGKTAGWQTG